MTRVKKEYNKRKFWKIQGIEAYQYVAVFAVLSSVFAALTSILAKVGIEGVNSNLATAVRTVVVLIMAWGMVFLTGGQSGLSSIGKKELALPDPVGPCHRGILAVLL